MSMDIRYLHDDKVSGLFPLTLLKEVQQLRCGILTLQEKNEEQIKKIKALKSFVVFINSRLLMDESVVKALKTIKMSGVIISGGTPVIAVVKKAAANGFSFEKADSLCEKKVEIQANLIEYAWDLIYKNAEEIKKDLKIKKFKARKKNVFVGKNVKIKPGVVLDAEDGPIAIDDNVTILGNSVIMGPAYIGKGSTVKALAKIYGGTSIGPLCKVGGEIEATIFQGYANKQHEGFIGHSFIGEWVNLGADTNNSDLKNNYENVKVRLKNKTVDTDRMFVGLIMGDHSKTGINSMFNTGTVAGISCNLFGSGYMPKYIPSFSWGGPFGLAEYDIEKALKTAKAAMKRRNVAMTKEYESSFRNAFALTANERKS